MFIQTEITPNPATVKFMPDTALLPMGAGPYDFRAGSNTHGAPLAIRLLNIPGVDGVMITPDYVAVTKAMDADWATLKTQVLMAVMDHVTSGDVAVDTSAPLPNPLSASGARGPDRSCEDPVIAQIKELLDTRIRPAVANDGGDITFSHFDQGVVYLHMRGACASCPSSTATLKNGIENMLKHYIPDVTEVRAA